MFSDVKAALVRLSSQGAVGATLALAIVLSGCNSRSAPLTSPIPTGDEASLPDQVRVGFLGNGLPAGIGYVLEDGRLFESQRLSPQFQRFGSVDGLQRALINSTIDVAVGLSPFAVAWLLDRDTPVVVVAAIQQADERIVVPVSSTIQSFADLKGKKVGTQGPGTLADAAFQTILSAAGLGPGDVARPSGTEAQLVLQIESGQIDAAVLHALTVAGLPDPARYRVIGELGAEWRKAANAGAPPFVGTVTVRQGFLDGYPDITARTVAAVVAATRWGRDHPAEVRQLLVRNLRMTDLNAANFAKAWSDFYLATLDDDAMRAILQSLEPFRDSATLKAVPSKDAFFNPAIFQRAVDLAR